MGSKPHRNLSLVTEWAGGGAQKGMSAGIEGSLTGAAARRVSEKTAQRTNWRLRNGMGRITQTVRVPSDAEAGRRLAGFGIPADLPLSHLKRQWSASHSRVREKFRFVRE